MTKDDERIEKLSKLLAISESQKERLKRKYKEQLAIKNKRIRELQDKVKELMSG